MMEGDRDHSQGERGFTFVCLGCFYRCKKPANRCSESSGSVQCDYCTSRCVSCERCGSAMRQIDDNMVEIIILLNRKGYRTLSSCGGNGGHSIFVSVVDVGSLKRFPRGFNHSTNRINADLTIVCIEYPPRERESEDEISRNVGELRKWAVEVKRVTQG